jgi:hypothetical protein
VQLIGVGLLAIACRDRRWPAWQVAAAAVLMAAALNVVLGNFAWTRLCGSTTCTRS